MNGTTGTVALANERKDGDERRARAQARRIAGSLIRQSPGPA